MVAIPAIRIDLAELNHTELVLLAKWCGLPASRGIVREVLIDSLEKLSPVETPIPFDEKRNRLSTWIKRHWNTLRMQMPKRVCPKCDLCKDLQILDCYTINEAQVRPGPARR